MIVKLFSFPHCTYYSASATATSWGAPTSIIAEGQTEPPNSMSIGITSFFCDIAENTDNSKLSGFAIYSRSTHKWDIFPDSVASIDNVTIVTNSSGQNMVADYTVTDTSLDKTDFESTGTKRGLFQWITALFRKIRGLHSDVSTLSTNKLDKVDIAGNQLYAHTGSTQANIAYAVDANANAIVQRSTTGAITLPQTQTTGANDAVGYKYVVDKLDSLSTSGAFAEQILTEADWK